MSTLSSVPPQSDHERPSHDRSRDSVLFKIIVAIGVLCALFVFYLAFKLATGRDFTIYDKSLLVCATAVFFTGYWTFIKVAHRKAIRVQLDHLKQTTEGFRAEIEALKELEPSEEELRNIADDLDRTKTP